MSITSSPGALRAGAARAGTGGFTLLELLVVMVIIGLLAGFVAPRYFSQVGKSQVKAAKAQVDALDKAIESFRLDMNRLPTTVISDDSRIAIAISAAPIRNGIDSPERSGTSAR